MVLDRFNTSICYLSFMSFISFPFTQTIVPTIYNKDHVALSMNDTTLTVEEIKDLLEDTTIKITLQTSF